MSGDAKVATAVATLKKVNGAFRVAKCMMVAAAKTINDRRTREGCGNAWEEIVEQSNICLHGMKKISARACV